MTLHLEVSKRLFSDYIIIIIHRSNLIKTWEKKIRAQTNEMEKNYQTTLISAINGWIAKIWKYRRVSSHAWKSVMSCKLMKNAHGKNRCFNMIPTIGDEINFTWNLDIKTDCLRLSACYKFAGSHAIKFQILCVWYRVKC